MKKPTGQSRGRTQRMPRAKLAAVLDRVADEYAHFISDPPLEELPPDAKNFAARQSAARVALAHISELAAMATEDAEEIEATVEDVLAKARAMIAREGEGDDPPTEETA